MTWVCWLHETRPFTSNEVVVQSNQRQFISCQLQLRITALTAVVIDLQFMFLAYTQSPTLFDVFLRDGLICEYTGIRYRLFTSDNGGGKCNCPRCLSVCLSVSKITQKCMHGFRWHFACRQVSGHGRTDQLLSPIQIILRMLKPDCFLP